MYLSNISKHAKAARNADIKRRESIIKENPQPVEPVLISQESIITGEVHTEIPNEILMDMSELDAREAKEREENERKAAETAPVPVLLIDSDELPQDLTEPVPEKEEYISAEDLISNHRLDISSVKSYLFIKYGIFITLQGLPISHGFVPLYTFWSIFSTFDIFKSHFIRSNHTPTGPHLNT